MAADFTAYQAVLKEVWTQSNLEKQFYDKNPFLDRLEKETPTHSIGEYAIVPVHVGRSGGYSAVPRTGSQALNPADSQKVAQAQYTWTNHWFQIGVEEETLRSTAGNADAVAKAADLEVNGALSDLQKQITRQFLGGNGDALIAQCGTTTASTTVALNATANQALVRGWLYPGLKVDIGTTADEDAVVAGATITAVTQSTSAPTITIDSSVTTSSSHYVSIADARSGTTSYEANGLRNIVGSATLGGLSSTTYPGWQATNNSTAQDLSLGILLAAQQNIAQQGASASWVVTSLKQQVAFYKQLQSQVRFTGDTNLGSGNVEKPTWNGLTIDAEPDVLDGDWFMLSPKDLILVRDGGPRWQNQDSGGNILVWQQGTTRFVGGLHWHIQLGAKKRNTHYGFTGLN